MEVFFAVLCFIVEDLKRRLFLLGNKRREPLIEEITGSRVFIRFIYFVYADEVGVVWSDMISLLTATPV
jgi:hypothetical protein